MAKPRKQLFKSPTGIQGLDEITGGGLPKGRLTLKLAQELLTASYQSRLELLAVIEDQKRVEEALEASERKYRMLADNTLDVIWAMDLDFTFTYGNPAVRSLMGHSPEEWIGSRLPEHCDEENFAKIIQVIVDEMAKGPDGVGIILESVLLNKKREPIPVEIHGKVMFDENGAPIFLQGIARDISGRKREEEEREKMKEQLLQSQKMEAIGTLTGGIAHDFNNLLTTIIGNTVMTIAKVGKESPLYEFLEDIKGAGERAAELIRQLMAFSRKQVIKPEVVNLNKAVGNMDRMLQRIIREDIELKTILSPDLGRIEADVGQMEQIIMNLAVNARDAMPEGGKLTIETSNVELDETYALNHIVAIPGPYVMLAVSDTGTGMTKKVQAKIFEPFFTTKDNVKGTGLGLSTVFGIVKQSKGNIWVYSEPGKGSTFKIHFPRVKKTIRTMERPEKKEESLQGSETILVVEDDDMVRELAIKILKRYGYTVLFAGNGQEAFHICREHREPVQLMLTDVVMPGMGGRELAKSLEELRPEMKVLFMSGYTDNIIVHHSILDNDVAFIQKPFRPEGLARKVREVLDA
jgi:two-component system, cell cycle sensor histidine kinase and response regulator CckA